MELIKLMARYYVRTAARTARLWAKNWMTAGILILYSIIIYASSMLTGRLGLIGGMINAVVAAACIGSWLYIVETIINSRIADFDDVKESFRHYTLRTMNVTFYIWLASLIYDLIISRLLSAVNYGSTINMIIYLVVIVLFNPLPEFIYQTLHPEIQLFGDSLGFIRDNFLEWLIPNAIFGALFYFLSSGRILFDMSLSISGIIKYLVSILLFLYLSIYRGILFRFLNESTRRSRLFKLRNFQ